MSVRATDMLTAAGEKLPIDVQPPADCADLTGAMAMTQLRAALREIGAQGKTVRME